jgi:DNA invertase Pin-like site-specific DNA recombinase
MKKKVLYVRTSSVSQNNDRQKVNQDNYDFVLEDKCSGSIPLFEREQGKKLHRLIKDGVVEQLDVTSIDRLGRNLKDILITIEYFTERQIPIHFVKQGLTTMDETGKQNPISKMMISILGVVSEMEREQIRERQREGIELGKLRGVYKGRLKGTQEDILSFLSKPKNKKVIELLNKGYKGVEVSQIVGVSQNTVCKVRKLLV